MLLDSQMENIMDNKFLDFFKPLFDYIDSGKLFRKPFSWLYMAFAVINAILPFYILFVAIDSGIFKAGAKFVFAVILVWIFILAACLVGALLWWNRKDKVLETSKEGSEFPAIPVISHFIQTSGEWLGLFMAIVGVGFSLIATIFLGSEASYLSSALGLPFDAGLMGIILFPILGFLAIVMARFLAEQFRALASIANNTKK